MKGQIFDIQNYVLHDGPGVRSCVFFKGCPMRCQWCHNPESHLQHAQLAFDSDSCTACGMCVPMCLKQARSLVDGRLELDRGRCVDCGICAQVCLNDASRLIGRQVTVEQVLAEVLPDRPFFEASGGGVTISGGEPTAQADFLLKLLDGLRAEGIHTALETCGLFPADLISGLVSRVDLFLYDLKHLSSERHRQATGQGNETILANFESLLEQVGPKRLVPRIPVIPGFNADEQSLGALVDYLLKLGFSRPVQLMPFHHWAKNKYSRLGRTCVQRGDLDLDTKKSLGQMVTARGLPAQWN